MALRSLFRPFELPQRPDDSGKRLTAEWLLNQGRDAFESFLAALSEEEADELQWYWPFWAREKQMWPDLSGDWNQWILRAGRGFGKTRCGAELVRYLAENALSSRIALVGKTIGDVRDVMIEGESGIMSISPPWSRPVYIASKRLLRWPNGVKAWLYSDEEPEQLRGPQHDLAWCDEIAKWRHEDTYDQLMFGLRLGSHPRLIGTTTLQPKPWIKRVMNMPGTILVAGTTFENEENLARTALVALKSRYEGTRLGRQELYGEYLEDAPGALWQRAWFEREGFRVKPDSLPPLKRVTIAMDPAVTAHAESDETGIVAAGLGFDGRIYVLSDKSGRYAPEIWARMVVKMFDDMKANIIVGEVNNGGDLVERMVRIAAADMHARKEREVGVIPFRSVHASRGKAKRAEPVALVYEQGRVSHVGTFDVMEDQMCQFTPDHPEQGFSPDRADAAVWAIWELLNQGSAYPGMVISA